MSVSKWIAVISLLPILVVAGCSGKKQVTRLDPNTTVDLSGKWNDTDSRLVSEQMVGDILRAPWLVRYQTANGEKRPTVIVGNVRNKTSEQTVKPETFTKDIERAFVNSGVVRVVASSDERGGIRDERRDQQDFSSPETVKSFGREHGADYMLMGVINSIADQEEGERVVFYQVDLELTDIQTNEKVWIDQKEIKKYVARGKYKG